MQRVLFPRSFLLLFPLGAFCEIIALCYVLFLVFLPPIRNNRSIVINK